MNRLWIVRTVALLLVFVGLQGGSFRDLDGGQQWVYGADNGVAAVLAETREPDAVPLTPPAAQPPRVARAPLGMAFAAPARTVRGSRAFLPHLHPDPTGPPRA